MSEIRVPMVKRKPPHGQLNEPGTQYVIPSTEKDYAPWIIEPVAPTWRDWWAILRKRYVPKLWVYRPTSVAEMNHTLKAVWSAPRMLAQLQGDTALHTDLP